MALSLHDTAKISPPGDATPGLQATLAGSIVARLDHLGALIFRGEDAENFLQGQLTCEVQAGAGQATYGAYCSPKGRMLATFLLWRADEGFVMVLPREVASEVLQRLARFVLRSKVKIEEAGDRLAFVGCAGPDAARVLRKLGDDLPEQRLQLVREADGAALLRLDESRWLLAGTAERIQDRLTRLSGALEQAGAQAWQWLDVRQGIPWIVSATQDKLIPQMANLDLIGGVSFTKGCYTGQEIVARTQHLGKVKRRMFLAAVDVAAAPGDELYAEDLGDQASGLVLNAARAPSGEWNLLVVVQADSREKSTVHLKSLAGPPLRFLPLPYSAA
jgi:folate-binding protein YgfZ